METKFCFKCKKEKLLIDWNKCKIRGTQPYCRDCTKKRDKEYYSSNKRYRKSKIREYALKNKKNIEEFLNEVKKAGCSFCCEKESVCMDFHHKHGNKEFNIGESKTRFSLNRVKKEVSKCVLVCSNCHRKIHNGILKI